MSGTFPALPLPSALTLRSLQPTLVSVAHSLKRQVRSRGGQRWGFSVQYKAKRRDEIALLISFALAQRGQYGNFTFVPALLGQPQSAPGGTPLANGATASGRSVPTDGWTPSVTAMKAGDFVKFGGHAKVYMLTADVVSNGAGQATLAIEPALYSAVADNEALTVSSVPFTVAFGADSQDVSLAGGPRYDWSCELVEVL